MSKDNEMTIDERPKYLWWLRQRYRTANKKVCGARLDET